MDRTTKIILAAIAAGLWANALGLALRPTSAAAQANQQTMVLMYLGEIANGACANHKIC